MIVIDASVAVAACLATDGFSRFAEPLVAPPLMWSEARSVLHELAWRGELAGEHAAIAHASLKEAPVDRREHANLSERAWRLADDLGWPRTCDAEYDALAQLLGCRLVTLDGRLVRGAARLDVVITPADL